MTLGATAIDGGGVRFRVWAPAARSVTLHVRRDALPAVSYQLSAASSQLPAASSQLPALSGQPEAGSRELEAGSRTLEAGYWEIVVPDARAGDRYAYSLDGGAPLPDPVSRFQPDGVHGWSEVVDPGRFAWTDDDWRGLDPARAVIYELHVGTFTPQGTFRAAIDRLPYLRDLGVTAIELMPLADFAGNRNWGYDGVALFAPSRAYGRPDDLRAFVDAAHRHDLAVLVDVVYNHLGPEGAYLPVFAPPFLTAAHATPWGPAVNLRGEQSAAVRRLLVDNARHWIAEYHVDGLRLDATHALVDEGTPHFVAELVEAVRETSRGRALVYAEDARNLAATVDDVSRGGWGLDGVWADDFHHVVRRMVAGDSHGYYEDYAGTALELANVVRNGWLYTGQHSKHLDQPRGTDPSRLPLRKAIVCIQNHDQIGNRAFGDRLHHTIDAAAWRAANVLLLTAPMTPLLFMGQEWAASTPFAFFTDFEPALAGAVVDGRRREFAAFPEFAAPGATERIPSPQAEATFEASRLRWPERREEPFARALALTSRLLAMRRDRPSLGASDACTCDALPLGDDAVSFVRRDGDGEHLIVVKLRGRGDVHSPALAEGRWEIALDTEDPSFAPDPCPPAVDAGAGRIVFERPGALVFTHAQG